MRLGGRLARRAVTLAAFGAFVLGGAAACSSSNAGADTAVAISPTTVPTSTAATAAPTVATTASAVSSTSPAPEAAPVLPATYTDSDGNDVTVTDVSRIIPVNGDLAEVVWALGLGDNVVATDISATYPAAADATPKIGYQRALTAETILSYEPTVILADDLAGPPEVLDQLRTTGIPVVIVKRLKNIDAPANKMAAVATALGVPGRGAQLVEQTRGEIADALEAARTAVTESGRPKVLALYLRGEGVQLTFGKGSGVDVLIDAAGGIDVGTAAGIVDTQQLSEEAVIAAAPDIILVTTTGLESVGGVDGLLSIPGIANTPAGEHRRVVAFEDQYLYGFGPRSGQLLGELVTTFHST